MYFQNSTFGLITTWSGGVSILPVIGGMGRNFGVVGAGRRK